MRNKTIAGNWKTDIGWPEIDKWYYEEGLTKYSDIRNRCIELCGSAPSNGTLSPHFNAAVKEKAAKRQIEYRKTLSGMIAKRIDAFQARTRSSIGAYEPIRNGRDVTERGEVMGLKHVLQSRFSLFRHRIKKGEREVGTFDSEDAFAHLIKFQDLNVEKGTCTDYLTGETIKLLDENWDLDHLDPNAGNDVENMRLTKRHHNAMKTDLTLEDLLKNCEAILRHNKPELFST